MANKPAKPKVTPGHNEPARSKKAVTGAAAMKGPAIFLAQFAGADAPFDNLANITRWAGERLDQQSE